jgi:hypothetical protein
MIPASLELSIGTGGVNAYRVGQGGLPSRIEPDYLRTIESACEGDSARMEAWTKGNRDMISGGSFDEIMFNAYKILKG